MFRFLCFPVLFFASIVDAAQAQSRIAFDVLVLDDYTLEPLHEAQVTLLADGVEVLSTHTGPDGRARINLSETGAEHSDTEVPNSFALSGNYPNPFVAETKADLAIPEEQALTIEVFTVLGQRIATERLTLASGYHTLNLNLAHLPTGVYLLRVTGAESKTINLLKTGISAHRPGPVLSVQPGQPGQNLLQVVPVASIAEVGSYSVRVTMESYGAREMTAPDTDDTLEVAMSRNNRVTFLVEQGASADQPGYELYVMGVDTEIMTSTPDEIELKSGFYYLEGQALYTFINQVIEIASRDTTITLEAPWIPPDDGLSSFDRISGALENEEIDEETALIYQVFASFNDPRLPQEFRGNDSLLFSGKIQMEVMQRFDDLSPEARETVGPFLIQPFYEGSWWDLRRKTSGTGSGSEKGLPETADVPPCTYRFRFSCTVSEDWTYIDGANIRYWFRGCLECSAGYRDIAREAELFFVNFIENAWEKLSELGLKEPLPDHVDPRTGQAIPNHGGDPRLDVIRLGPRDLGYHGKTFSYTGRFEETPAWIVFKSTVFERPLSLAVLIHELMHAFQFAYDLHVHHTNYEWMMEATANWAIDYVQPNIQQEHRMVRSFLSTPYLSLDDTSFDRNYGAYLWFFYLSKTHAPAIIKEVFDRISNHTSLQANELALRAMRNSDKGFEETFPGFPVLNLNRDDIQQTRQYRVWDPAQPQLQRGVPTTPESLTLGGGLDNQTATLMYDVKYLAAEYTHFQFADPNIRSVAFFNGYSTKLDLMTGLFVTSPLHEEQKEGLDVQALVKIQGEGWQLQDWTGKPVVAFCRELSGQNIEEVIIIHSNSLHTGASENYPEATWRGNQQPQVHYSNMACARWTGTLTGVIPGELEERVHMDVTFEALPYPDIHEESAHFGFMYSLVEGTLDWEISGTQLECTVNGQASGIALPEGRILSTHNFVPTGGGGGGFFARKAWFNIAWDPIPVSEFWTCGDETHEFERTVGSAFWVFITETEVDQAGQTIAGSEEEHNHWGVNWTWHFTSQDEMISTLSR